MRALLTDTTCDTLTVILLDGDKKIIRQAGGEKRHSAYLMELVDSVMKEGGISIDDIDVFSAVVGPGSFTGIRIGLSSFNALAYATGKKRIEVNSFEILTYGKDDGIFSIDAGNGNRYICTKKKGKIEFGFLEKDAPCDFNFDSVNDDIVESFLNIVCEKFERGEFSNMLTPLYLRKSQAERNLNENK